MNSMKLFYNTIPLSIATLFFFLFTACQEDEGTAELPDFAPPSISIASPDLSTGELTPTVGETVGFNLNFTAEAGLSQIFVNGKSVKKYDGSTTQGELSYDFLVQDETPQNFIFTIEDAYANTTSTDEITVVPIPGEDLGFLLIDFSGASTSNETKTVMDWDVRKLTNFNVSGSLTSSASAEVVHSQSIVSFAQPNPAEGEEGKVHKITKAPADGFDNWGGWVHILYNLKTPIPTEQVEALPQWNAETNELTAGSKVIKVDAYYDATVDPDFSWENLIALTEVWNSDPSKGYKVDLILANYAKHANVESGYDASGYYIGYSAYIPEPNKWVTLTFNTVDLGRVSNFLASGSETAATVAEIDCIDIKPAPGYTSVDRNPLYLKNLRIMDVE